MNILTSAPAGRRRHLSRAALVGAGALLLPVLTGGVAQAAVVGTFISFSTASPVDVGSSVAVTLGFTNSAAATTINPISVTATPAASVRFVSGSGFSGCNGRAIGVSGPAGAQTVTVTPNTIANGATCIIILTGVAEQATAPGAATLATTVSFGDGSTSGAVNSSNTLFGSASLMINKAQPSIVSIASKSNNTVTDSASVSGRVNPVDGTLQFKLYGPDDATCTGAVVSTTARTVGANSGPFMSDPFVATAPGTYRYVVTYDGDVNNLPATSACNAAGETVTVTQADITAGTPPVVTPPVVTPPVTPPAGACVPGAPNTGNNNRGFGNSGNNNRGNCNSGNNNRGDNSAGNNNRP